MDGLNRDTENRHRIGIEKFSRKKTSGVHEFCKLPCTGARARCERFLCMTTEDNKAPLASASS
jgi:hypothetical protein